jgi:hypothetical protein
MLEWLTVDRAISLSAISIGAVFSAIAAVYSIRNYRLAREARDETTAVLMRSWLLSISDEATFGDWHLCQIEERGKPDHWIVQIQVIKPRGALLAPPDPASYRIGHPGELRPAQSEAPSHWVVDWPRHRLPTIPQHLTLSFFIKSRRKSEIVSLRLTLEEMSASRRRRNITVNSNPVTWSKSAAHRM